MITRKDHDLQFRPFCMQATQSPIEQLPFLAGWVQAIEYSSRDNQHIDLVLDDDLDRLVRDSDVLKSAVIDAFFIYSFSLFMTPGSLLQFDPFRMRCIPYGRTNWSFVAFIPSPTPIQQCRL